MALLSLFKKYDTVLFDMDGVITTEQMYWNVTALTIYEMLHSKNYYGDDEFDVVLAQKNMKKIRKDVLLDDKIISYVKNIGVNSNWDLVYLVLGGALILNTKDDFEAVFSYIRSLDASTVFTLYDEHAKRLSDSTDLSVSYCTRLNSFWKECTDVFQEWFLGSKVYYNEFGKSPVEFNKPGLSSCEEPLVDIKYIHSLLGQLSEAGKRIGIGSGRPAIEVAGPLDSWDIRKYFTPDAIIDYTLLTNAEKRLNKSGMNVNLVKPHPYMFLKGIFGTGYCDEKILSGDYDKEKCKKALVIGDAAADMYSAFSAGCDFLAVLTGISGKSAKAFFEKENATYIFEDITKLIN